MGVMSKAVLCMKAGPELEAVKKLAVFGQTDDHLECAEGEPWMWDMVKWYVEDGEVHELYSALRELDPRTYRLITVCYDYPETADEGIGRWDNNPWDVPRRVHVDVHYS